MQAPAVGRSTWTLDAMWSQVFLWLTLTWLFALLGYGGYLLSDNRGWRTFATIAVLFCAGFVLLYGWGYFEAATTIKRWGHNVDSGVFQMLAAIFLCAPGTVLFAIGALVLWARSRALRGNGI